MRKKYLSALLFGALLFASAGTFTSCKDYDDDIENLQGQISANKEAIAKLQSLVDAGDYVTGVSKDASGNLVFAFSKSGPKTIELDKPEKAQKLEIKGGELYIDDAPTGIKVAEPTEPTEHPKDQIIIENGVWSVLQEDGTYKSTGIPVSGVTAVKNDKQQWVLTITDANGATAKVTVPSAASVMSDLELVGWFNTASDAYDAANNTLNLLNIKGQDLMTICQDITVNYCYLDEILKVKEDPTTGTETYEETTWSAQKDVVKKQVLTTLAAEGTKLVARVAPADLDLSSLSFSLQDSKGNKLPISLTSSNFTGKLTRAAANSSIHFLSLDITDATYDAEANYTNLFGGNDDLYSLVEESGARSTYGMFGITAVKLTTFNKPKVVEVNPDGTLPVGGPQGTGVEASPFVVDLNTPTKLVFEHPAQVYDYYVEPVDQAAADEFGFSTDKKKGTITLTKSIDLVTRAALELNVYALRVDGKIYKSQVWVKPSSILSAAVTLKAGEKVIAPIFDGAGVVTTADKTQFTVSLADMFASMSATDKSRWMSAVTGANGGIEVAEFKNADGAYNSGVYTDVIKVSFLKADGTVGNNTNAASLLVTVPYKTETTKLLTPYKEYTMKLNFLHDETGTKSVMNTVKVTVTPTLPTLSSYMTKRSALWDGNKLMAYFDDPSTATPLPSKYKMNNGFTKLGWKDNATTPNTLLDIKFTMDADQKLEASNGNKYAANDGDVTDVAMGNVIEIKDNHKDKVRTNMPLAYGKDLNVKVNAKYMGVYDYSAYATTKAQLADAAFQIKVQSALEAGTIAPANGSSISLTPSGASRLMQITAKDIKATAYNQDAPYNVFKEVLATTPSTTIGWRYSYIKDVKFESADNLLYTVENNGVAVDPIYDRTANKEVESYVSLKAGNTTSATQTTIKVTVTDWYGYTKVVNLPITINKANTGNN